MDSQGGPGRISTASMPEEPAGGTKAGRRGHDMINNIVVRTRRLPIGTLGTRAREGMAQERKKRASPTAMACVSN